MDAWEKRARRRLFGKPVVPVTRREAEDRLVTGEQREGWPTNDTVLSPWAARFRAASRFRR
jgi:hypothetical protein